MGNLFARVVFWLWPLVVVGAFASRRHRESPARTACWMMLLGSMFLPFGVDVDLPVLPALNKLSWTAAWVWGCVVAFHGSAVRAAAPGHNVFRVILAIGAVGVMLTVLNNPDALRYGPKIIPGHGTTDMLSAALQLYVEVYIPFAVGQRLFRTEQDLRDLCSIFARALLLYTPFMLYEARFAPVLHANLYGMSPFGFSQAMRGGGYRVAVFMPHGLMLAMFTFAALMLARALGKSGFKLRPVSPKGMFWLGLGLLVGACRTLAAFLYAGVSWLLTLRAPRPRSLAVFLIVVSSIVAIYPVTRGNGSFPTDKLIEWAERAGEDRARSLAFRFDNEDILLAHANKRPYFGWGGFGRNRIYNERGDDVSTTDGTWIIAIGTWGYVGFAVQFAFVILPLLRAAGLYGRAPARMKPMLGALAIVSACLTIDLIPNARQDTWTLILSGALWTLSEALSRKQPRAQPVAGAGAATPGEAASTAPRAARAT